MTSLNNRVKKGILKMWFKKLRSVASQSYIELSDAKIERSRQCYYVSACT